MKLLSDLRYEAADLGIGRGVAFFHHSPRLAYRAGNHVVVIDSRSGQELSRFDLGEARLTALAVSSNDQQIAAGCEAALSSVVVMESATGQVQQRFSSSHVDDLPLQVQFSPSDDRVLAVFGRSPDGTESDPYNSSCVRQWWLDDGEELPIIKSPVYNLGLVDAAYINRGEQIVVTVRNVAGTLWDSHTGGRVEQEEFAPFHTAALHVGADLIAAGAIDGRVHLFSLTTRMKRSTILAHESQVFDMAFSTDGNRLLTSGTDGTVRMWNVATGESLWVTSQWSPGVYWVAGDEYVVAGGKWFEQPPQLISATNGEFCPQPESWTTRPVVSVAASFNSLVATGHVTEPVKLWDLQTMQVVGEFVETPLSSYVGANAVAFNAESTLLAVSYDGTENQRSHIVLWDVAKRRPLASQDRVFGRILTMGFTPSGRLLATGSWGDSTLVLWDVPSLRPLGKLQVGPPRSGVLWLAFFDEGNQLVVLGSDGRLQFVQLSPSAPGEDKLSP
jgi:WD40 repeat protein